MGLDVALARISERVGTYTYSAPRMQRQMGRSRALSPPRLMHPAAVQYSRPRRTFSLPFAGFSVNVFTVAFPPKLVFR